MKDEVLKGFHVLRSERDGRAVGGPLWSPLPLGSGVGAAPCGRPREWARRPEALHPYRLPDRIPDEIL